MRDLLHVTIVAKMCSVLAMVALSQNHPNVLAIVAAHMRDLLYVAIIAAHACNVVCFSDGRFFSQNHSNVIAIVAAHVRDLLYVAIVAAHFGSSTRHIQWRFGDGSQTQTSPQCI